MSTTFESKTVARRSRTAFAKISVGVAVAAPFLGIALAALLKNPGPAIFGFLIALFGFLGNAVMNMTGSGTVEERGDLKVTGEGIELSGRLLLPTAKIGTACLMPYEAKDGRPVVRIERGLGSSLDLVTQDEDEGRKLLHALGRDASQAPMQFRFSWRHALRAMVVMFVLGAAGFGFATATNHMSGGMFLALMRFALPVVIGLTMLALRTKVTVAPDGILIEEPTGKRFISAREIDGAQASTEQIGFAAYPCVRLRLTSGEEIVFRAGSRMPKRSQTVAERISEMLTAYRAGGHVGAEETLLRGDRTVEAWVRGLRAAGAGADADGRTAPVPRDRLWRIVEDAAAAPAARAGAAVALAQAAAPDERARLLAVSKTSGQPKLRVALEVAAHEATDEAALAEALSELEASEGRAAART